MEDELKNDEGKSLSQIPEGIDKKEGKSVPPPDLIFISNEGGIETLDIGS